MPIQQQCTVVSKTPLSGDTYHMTLKAGEMVAKTFRAPGQFIHIACPPHFLRRPTSVCACGSGAVGE